MCVGGEGDNTTFVNPLAAQLVNNFAKWRVVTFSCMLAPSSVLSAASGFC